MPGVFENAREQHCRFLNSISASEPLPVIVNTQVNRHTAAQETETFANVVDTNTKAKIIENNEAKKMDLNLFFILFHLLFLD